MRIAFTDRMEELYALIEPYFLRIDDNDEVVWKEDTPDEIKEMYEEFLHLGREQRKLAIDMLL